MPRLKVGRTMTGMYRIYVKKGGLIWLPYSKTCDTEFLANRMLANIKRLHEVVEV